MDDKRKIENRIQIKKPVFILGGFGSTLLEFDPLVRELSLFCNPIVALIPEGSIQEVRDQLLEFLNSLGLSNIPAIGYSMGGRVLLDIKKHYEELFSRVVCLSSRIRTKCFDIERRIKFENSVKERLLNDSVEQFYDWWYKLPIYAGYRPEKQILIEKYQRSNQLLYRQFFNLSILELEEIDFRSTTAVHLIYGENDPLLVEMQNCFKESKEPIFVHKIDKSGHMIHLEQPEVLSDRIKEVLCEF